jgi:hypothetical protein
VSASQVGSPEARITPRALDRFADRLATEEIGVGDLG